MNRSSRIVAAGLALLVLAGAAWFVLRPNRGSHGPQSTSGDGALASTSAVYQVGRTPADEFAGVLAAAIPVAASSPRDAALRDAASSWLAAYATGTSAAFLTVMQDSAITPPDAFSDPRNADSLIDASLAGLRRIVFDPSGTRVVRLVRDTPHPFEGASVADGHP